MSKNAFPCFTLILVLMCSIIVSCKETGNSDNTSEQSAPSMITTQDIEKYCNLIELEATNNRRYKYQLISGSGKVLFEDTTFRLPPGFLFISDSIIRIRVGAGTNVFYDKFFDVTSDEVSDYFYAPYEIHKNMVISVHYDPEREATFLTIRDMFNQDSIFLDEKINFANSSFPECSIKDFKFINEHKVWIKYECDENGTLEEKSFDIDESDG